MRQDSAPSDDAATSAVAAPKLTKPSVAATLVSGWTEWVSKNRASASLVAVGIIVCIIVVAVVPPVCVLRGCGAGHGDEAPLDEIPVKRLLVHFDEIGKTVKSKVSPLLYDYFEEVVLSFGVNIVTFKTHKVLYEVQRVLEAQSDVLILLRDRPQFQAPTIDPYLGFGLRSNLSAARRRHLQGSASGVAEPGDELTPVQWSLERVAARDAWTLSRGERVVVAVVDTGCDLEHPDLTDNIWVNPREIPGNNVDDDQNGFEDDVNGFDFAGPCEDPTGPGCGRRPHPQDAKGHGSHCTGIIAAVRNNRVGIVGIAPNVSIMCLKVTPNNGVFYTSQNLQAIDYAIRNGAHIVSCSFGPVRPITRPTESQRAELRNETEFYALSLAALRAKNMLLVAAAGNELTNLDAVEHYNPCTLVRNFSDNVMCVMATDDLDQRLQADVMSPPQGSNFGSNTVSVGAPGLQILSTVPALVEYNYSRWTNMSGSSMATPLVAGVAALVVSVLGSKDGNFYKGSDAKAILLDSGVFVPNLEVARSHRINASEAVQMALARVAGFTRMVPQAGFSVSAQSAMMEGFNLTYYASTAPDPDPTSIVDESTMTTRVSRFEGFKLNNGTLAIRASMNLSTPGLYLIKVNTTASPADLRVFVGQAQLRNLSDTYLIRSDGGWYSFEVLYVNPVAPVDIQMAEPNSGGEPALSYLSSVFYVTTDAPPRSFHYAPDIALSSTWQVLTRTAPGPLRWSSIQSSLLQFNQPYNNSAVLEALNFTRTSNPRLRDALRLTSSSGGGGGGGTGQQQQVVGIAHTRMRAPEGTSGSLRFKITCELCALYINGLRVADVYDPLRPLQSATQLTNCVALGGSTPSPLSGSSGSGSWGSGGLHELVLRFATPNAGNASLVVGWLPCGGDDSGASARPLGPLLANNLFWQPSSGVAGYVPGMQCDVWLNRPQEDPTKTWQPLIKFRLPTALAHTAAGVDRTLPKLLTRTDPPVYDIFTVSRCNANETAAGANCSAAAAFALTDIINRSQEPPGSAVSVHMRCWTYVNAGFRNGTVQTLKAGEVNVYLGAQTVLRSPPTISIFYPSVAPNTTALGNYYQLLVVELPSLRISALAGLRNGSTASAAAGAAASAAAAAAADVLVVDMARTLLPLPLVSSTGGSVAAAATSSAAAGVVRPSYLGASPFATGAPPGASPGLCGLTFTPSVDFNTATLRLSAVLHNISLTSTPIRGTPCVNASAGLAEAVCHQPPGRTSQRYVQAGGYLRVPAAAAGAGGAAAGTAMRRWTLRVVDDPDQTTVITIGDVTVRNGVDYPSSVVTASETVLHLPTGAVSGGDVFLPAVATARSRVTGSQAVFQVLLLAPDSRAAWRVNASLWYCRS